MQRSLQKEKPKTYHLLSYHYHRLDREPSVTVVKQILQGRSEQIYNEDVMEALLTKVVNIRDTSCRLG